jgi:hypothetical protein
LSGAFGQGSNHGTDRHFRALGDDDGQHAISGRLQFGGNFIGFEGDEGFAFAHGAAGGFVPAGDVGRGDGLSEGGDFDIEGHGKSR